MEGKTQNQLITKVQYKNFEPGEFTDRRGRTYDELIQLIENFPWEQQRDHLQVGPTNPSVTIEGEYRHFLKLTLYYHDGFVLYYLDDAGHLYTKSFPRYQNAYPYLQSFFTDSTLDTADLELQHFWLQGKSIHFLDQDFHYTINKPKVIFYISLIGVYALFLLVITTGMLIGGITKNPALLIVAAFVAGILVLISVTMRLLINHLRAVIGKELILSRGNYIFYYGKAGQPQQWDKKNIIAITDLGRSASSRSNYGKLVRIDIRETDSPSAPVRSIYIPSILIRDSTLLEKFPAIKPNHVSKTFPFIPSDASSPS
jgi:hypothetical protein